MKLRFPNITICLIGAGLLAATAFVSAGQNTVAAQSPVDPAHAAHVAAAAQANAPVVADAATANSDLAQQLSQLQEKVARLEAVLAKSAPLMSPPSAVTPMPGMPGAVAPAAPAMKMDMGKMKPGGGMPGMSVSATPAPSVAANQAGAAMPGMPVAASPAIPAMSASAAPAQPMAGMSEGMMGMMDKMMGMMDRMMPMSGPAPMPTGGSMPAGGGGMGMDMMKMDAMGSGGAMPATPPAAGMASMGGGGGMKDMDMMGMAASAGAMPQSALPGFPGASHLYHIGATGFFLDHPQHIALTTEQQAALNHAKEQAELAKSTADRMIEQAEQDLWTFTAADQPDAAQIETKLAEIGKLTGDKRLTFIRAVGDASKLLTDEQRQILTGFAPPAPGVPAMAPAAAPMAGGMSDM